MTSTRRTIALFALLFAALPASADAAGTLASARLDPLAGGNERGLIIIEALPARTTIRGSFSWGETNSYSFHLSRRTCGEVEDNPNRPRFIGGSIYSANPANGLFEGKASRQVTRRQLRATKSIVLTRDGDPRACGRPIAYKLTDVLISS